MDGVDALSSLQPIAAEALVGQKSVEILLYTQPRVRKTIWSRAMLPHPSTSPILSLSLRPVPTPAGTPTAEALATASCCPIHVGVSALGHAGATAGMEALGSGGVRRFTGWATMLGAADILQVVVDTEVLPVEFEEPLMGG